MEKQSPPVTPDFSSSRGKIAENCVEYYLFLINQHGDARLQLRELENLRVAATKLANRLTEDYIWQRDEFDLELKTGQGECLRGVIPLFMFPTMWLSFNIAFRHDLPARHHRLRRRGGG